ncbi:MAG: hypothetical protein R3208_21635 [Ketobacteraceae bacterium]|nr:hypothetical protein [Ketobacteraceae bacterium]
MELPFSNNNAAPSTRTPGFAVVFGGGSTGGGLMDSAASVASSVGIDIGGDSTDPWQRSLMEVVSESRLAPAVDQLKLQIAQDSQSPAYGIEDEGDVQLGYADDQLYPVFTGMITRIQRSLMNMATITVCNGSYLLSQMRINESFEQQSAGDIVTSLAQSAGVETDTVEPGIDFPFYVVDDGRNLYQHIAELARKSGLYAFIGSDGKLNFSAPPSGEPVKTFSYGVDVLAMQTSRRKHPVDEVSAIGQGAAGSQGAEAWDWLLKDPQSVTASAGNGNNSQLISDHSLRSSEAAQQAAASKSFLIKQQSNKLRLTVVGAPEVFAGSRVAIAGVPDDIFNGAGIVESARHSYSKREGFVSDLVVLMDSEDNSLDLLGPLGGLL